MSCNDCQYDLWQVIEEFRNNEEASLIYLRGHGVLPTTVVCPYCNINCIYRNKNHDWQCYGQVKHQKKKVKLCNYRLNDRVGTFLQEIRVPAWKILLFVSAFHEKRFCLTDVCYKLHISTRTAVNWSSFCGEVCMHWLQQQQPISGECIEVEIDETAISRRKYNRGRLLKTVWLFGGIERKSGKKFIVPLITDTSEGEEPEIVPRTSEVLLGYIKQFIKPGSIIYSDCWKAYDSIPNVGHD